MIEWSDRYGARRRKTEEEYTWDVEIVELCSRETEGSFSFMSSMREAGGPVSKEYLGTLGKFVFGVGYGCLI